MTNTSSDHVVASLQEVRKQSGGKEVPAVTKQWVEECNKAKGQVTCAQHHNMRSTDVYEHSHRHNKPYWPPAACAVLVYCCICLLLSSSAAHTLCLPDGTNHTFTAIAHGTIAVKEVMSSWEACELPMRMLGLAQVMNTAACSTCLVLSHFRQPGVVTLHHHMT